MLKNKPEKKALILGISGQDGAYLAKHLLENGYQVAGVSPRHSNGTAGLWRINKVGIDEELFKNLKFHNGDITCSASVNNFIGALQPDEIYNLAAQSFVAESFKSPISTFQINATGVLNILETIRTLSPHSKFYQASTSEMFGLVNVDGQDESTPFHPRSPYGVAKAAAHYAVQNYREAYGLHASSGILFNHESPLRGEEFVTRKVTLAVARIKAGVQEKLFLGNVDAYRDWGFAGDYVRAMHLMLQKETPDDYVISTGIKHSVREMVSLAFDVAGLNPDNYVEHDESLMRPSDVPLLLGDSTKAHRELGWYPSVTFEQMIVDMVKEDIKRTNDEIKSKS